MSIHYSEKVHILFKLKSIGYDLLYHGYLQRKCKMEGARHHPVIGYPDTFYSSIGTMNMEVSI